jgi:hypothetical protein
VQIFFAKTAKKIVVWHSGSGRNARFYFLSFWRIVPLIIENPCAVGKKFFFLISFFGTGINRQRKNVKNYSVFLCRDVFAARGR